MFKTDVKYRDIWKIAYPIILGSIAQNLLNITDTAFLGRVGEIELGAGAIGGVYYFAIIMLGWGFGIGTQIIVARRNGEKDFPAIGRTIDHGLYFMVPLAILMFSLMKFLSDDFLFVMMKSEEVKQATSEYINWRAYGIFFAFINFLFRAFYVGLGKTKVITYTTTLMAIVNVVLDYCLIFGHFGFPEMGIAGAALASMIAESTATLFFIVYTRFVFSSKPYHLFHFKQFDPKLYFRIIRVSLPIMGQNFLSLATWLIFFLLVEKMGERQLAVSNIIRSFYFVLMMPMWGFASATSTLVSFLMGSKRDNEVISLVYKVMVLCLSGVGFMVLLGLLFPHEVVRIYTNDPALIEASLPVVYIVSLAALMLSATFIFFNAVSGTGKTLVSFLIEVITLTLYLGYIWFIIVVYQGNISTVWTSEWVYATLLGSMSFFYLKSGKWRGSVV
ncbi:MAG: MATE family efflux transporter [Bacteroidales bacterium]|nr:MATE family efflux transporter [Bacteroidales bacterium]MCF8402821.1 MATE family efflux transporter [Bacteroidales bacterium]